VSRVVMWLKLRQRDGGKVFYWFNTHLDPWSTKARTASAKFLRERITQIAGSAPCIVTGDFNSGPHSAAYQTLLAEQQPETLSLHDVFRTAHPVVAHGEGTFHFFTGWRGGSRIDWIFGTSDFQVVDSEIDHTRGPHGYPSDHFPVLAVLRWK
jgi:endonuclease/exonuclease/phosphatase family metal-dependent hydrolase